MLSIGLGLDNMIRGGIEEMGSINTIEVSAGYEAGRNSESVMKKVTNDDIKEILGLDYVGGVMPYIRNYDVQFKSGEYENYGALYAVDTKQMKDFGYKVSSGRILNDSDQFQILVGASVADGFYNNNARRFDPEDKVTMEEIIKKGIKASFNRYKNGNQPPKQYKMDIVGILEKSSMEVDRSIFVNLEYYNKFTERMDKKYLKDENKGKKKTEGYQQVKVLVKDIDQVENVRKKIEEMGFSAFSLSQFLDQAKKQIAMVQVVLGGMGGISLLVAAIGITNTMIMSIYERTKEIGVMKVIGANIKDIKRIFLVEAAMIGLLGGTLGIGFSYIISFIINHFAKSFMNEMGQGVSISIIPLWLVGSSMVFSTLVGIISGFLPAKRAMKLSALEAIRTS